MSLTISTDNFVNDLMASVDYILRGFVENGYQHLVQNNITVINVMMTFYVAWMGYKIVNRTLEFDLNVFARHMGQLIIVYALLTNWHLFYLFFYNIFTNEPGEITKTLIESNGSVPVGTNTLDAINSVFRKGMELSSYLFSHHNTFNFMPLILGICVFIATLLQCLIAVALLVYAKMAMALILFLGPLFISFMLWEATHEFFNKWVQKLVNYALIPILTCGILMLTLSLVNIALPSMTHEIYAGNPSFTGVIVYLGLAFISFLLYLQILPLCAALSGGVALSGMTAVLSTGSIVSGVLGTTKSSISKSFLGAKDALSKVRENRAQSLRDKKFSSGSGRYY